MDVRLWLITDEEGFPGRLDSLVGLLQKARPRTVGIVLRDRERAVRERLTVGRELRAITRRAEQLFVVAERLDLALVLGADGVHLPTEGVLPSAARKLYPDGWISRSAHEILSLGKEELASLNGLFLSPAFAPRKGRPPLGIEGLGTRIEEGNRRGFSGAWYALGGVAAENVLDARRAGAKGAAVIGAGYSEVEGVALIAALGIAR